MDEFQKINFKCLGNQTHPASTINFQLIVFCVEFSVNDISRTQYAIKIPEMPV